MTWTQTYTGRAFTPLDPRAEDVALEDIAHSLAIQCRFNGHCKHHYNCDCPTSDMNNQLVELQEAERAARALRDGQP